MAESQLGCFNKSLRWLGERPALSISENRPSVIQMNSEWHSAVELCLTETYWNFATRMQQIAAADAIAPAFAYQYAFAKPADWMKTYQVADNDQFNPLLRKFEDQNGYWFANIAPLYVKFISDDPNFGWNMARWTPYFGELLGIYLAHLCSSRVLQDQTKIDKIEKRWDRMRKEAEAKDAMDQPPGSVPAGTWVMSRAPRGSVLPGGSPFPWSDS